MRLNNKVSLQISLSPGDYPLALSILPHQLKALSGQVDEVILTVDTIPSKGRFANGWHAYRQQLNAFLEDEISRDFKVRILPVDYEPELRSKIAQYFFGINNIPAKDFRGGILFIPKK